mgnify:FL=1
MAKSIKIVLFFSFIFISCNQDNSDDLICDLICESGYVLDENNCECVDFREQYIGQWEFTKYWSTTHPYDPNDGDSFWIGEITYGDSDNTLFIPHGQIPELNEYEYCFCYEFEINPSGDINEDTYDADNFNYFFEGYINSDSLYYSSAEGSPFSSYSQTIYGRKIK